MTECFRAGVGEAISQYVQATPEYAHYLLTTGDQSDLEPSHHFESHETFAASSVIGRASELRRRTAALEIDIIHAHSSWAGVFSRLLRMDAPVVYQPHAFGMLAGSIGTRTAAQLTELALAPRTSSFAVLTPEEHRIAERLSRSTPAFLVVNRPTIAAGSADSWMALPTPWRVVMVGRLVDQKDPPWFAKVAEIVRQERDDVAFEWIGDGESRYRSLLHASGVAISGWQDKAFVADALAQASIYLHSSRYEGLSLALLDAALVGVPIVARQTPEHGHLPLCFARSPEAAAELVTEALGDDARLRELALASRRVAASHTQALQHASLERLYRETRDATHSRRV